LIVDASALLAIVLLEPDGDRLLEVANSADDLSISVVNFVEAGIKVDKDADPKRASTLDKLMGELAVEIVPVSLEQGRIARRAHRQFGRGSGHPANLNLGDCFAYALAKFRREPLLFKGNDFGQTDIEASA
jgi:ribonuclease VapC